MIINQNKKLIALWHESKKSLNTEIQNRQKLDRMEKIDESILESDGLEKYMKEAQ